MDKIEKEKTARRRRITEEIAQAMLEAGLSRKEFAIKMHRQPSEVTRWLSGNHNFTSDLLAEMSVVLSKPISGAEDVVVKGYEVDGYDGRSERPLLRDEESV
ncbi:MAG: helix-turn-helix transcriptional regulator, partial [Bacteroidales bacterium]|nr:helix-turn-helix transcriptional regulator [Bacteroidales bacterium]